jgi:hypothetical protein
MRQRCSGSWARSAKLHAHTLTILGGDPAEHAAEVQRFVGEEQARVEEEVRAQRAEKEGMASILRAAQLQIDELTRDVAALTAKAAAAHAEGAACQVSCA